MKRILACLIILLSATSIASAAENAIWQKALDKQTLRCGYVVYEPGFVKDMKSIYQKYNQYPHSFLYPTIDYQSK